MSEEKDDPPGLMSSPWFAEAVMPQMRVIVAAYYGDEITGLRVLAEHGYFDLYTDEWHHAPEGSEVARMALHDYLGLSWPEYVEIFSPRKP